MAKSWTKLVEILRQPEYTASIGVDLGVINASASATSKVTPERTFARKLLRYLEEKRMLYEAVEWEFVDQCVASALETKKYLVDTKLELKHENSFLMTRIENLIDAIHTFLGLTDRLTKTQNGKNHDWSDSNFRVFRAAIRTYRRKSAKAIFEIVLHFQLDIDDRLERILLHTDESSD